MDKKEEKNDVEDCEKKRLLEERRYKKWSDPLVWVSGPGRIGPILPLKEKDD